MSNDISPERLRRWVWNFLADATGDLASFYQILGRPGSADVDAPLDIDELDRAITDVQWFRH